jgi:hypothetical protein
MDKSAQGNFFVTLVYFITNNQVTKKLHSRNISHNHICISRVDKYNYILEAFVVVFVVVAVVSLVACIFPEIKTK